MQNIDIPAALKIDAQRVIRKLIDEVRAALAVVVSTEDGFELAAHVQDTAQAARLSAMASSICALGALAGEESGLGECASVVIQAGHGCMVMTQARRPDASLILSIVAGPDAILGQILYAGRTAVQALERAGLPDIAAAEVH
jgi:hypothetical protein